MRKTSKKIAAIVLAAAMCVGMTACNKPAASTPTSTPDTSVSTTTSTSVSNVVEEVEVDVATYTEAPSVAAKVQAGTLPKVDDRIPNVDNVFVETNDCNGAALEIGTYGDSLNWAFGGGSWDIARMALESIVHYNSDGTYYPNVIKDYKASEDFKEWTFYLREGMKWSDGVDFTSEDIEFWYEACHKTNWDSKASWKELHDSVTGEFAKLVIVGPYEVKWVFDTPKYAGDFIEGGDLKFCWAPKHYLIDMIPNSVWSGSTLDDTQALANAMAKGISYDNVNDLGKNTVYYFWNTPGLPTLNPWVLTTEEGLNNRKSTCRLIRNDYFWKVDAKGQQLPYLDTVNLLKLEADQAELQFLSGEVDVLDSIEMSKIQTLIESAAVKGNKVSVAVANPGNWGGEQFTFNYTNTDEKYATLFSNKDFRQAFSICVDRDNMAALITDGFYEGGQCAPSEGALGYSKEWATKWTEYDVAKAKSLLEGCGLTMGSDGFYKFADGTTVEINFFGYNTDDSAATTFEQFNTYFKAAGLKCTYTGYDTAYFDEQIDNNTWMACYGPHTAIASTMSDRPAPIVPISGMGGAEWYGAYGYYYESNGEKGVKPEGDMAKLVELYDQWKVSPSSEERTNLELQILKLHEENLWTIAFLEAGSSYSLVNDAIGNFAENAAHLDKFQYSLNIRHPWTFFRK